jgi:hypothetical protein
VDIFGKEPNFQYICYLEGTQGMLSIKAGTFIP